MMVQAIPEVGNLLSQIPFSVDTLDVGLGLLGLSPSGGSRNEATRVLRCDGYSFSLPEFGIGRGKDEKGGLPFRGFTNHRRFTNFRSGHK
jgi:hypothetical protein